MPDARMIVSLCVQVALACQRVAPKRHSPFRYLFKGQFISFHWFLSHQVHADSTITAVLHSPGIFHLDDISYCHYHRETNSYSEFKMQVKANSVYWSDVIKNHPIKTLKLIIWRNNVSSDTAIKRLFDRDLFHLVANATSDGGETFRNCSYLLMSSN